MAQIIWGLTNKAPSDKNIFCAGYFGRRLAVCHVQRVMPVPGALRASVGDHPHNVLYARGEPKLIGEESAPWSHIYSTLNLVAAADRSRYWCQAHRMPDGTPWGINL